MLVGPLDLVKRQLTIAEREAFEHPYQIILGLFFIGPVVPWFA